MHAHWLTTHEISATVGQSNASAFLLRGLSGRAGRDVQLRCSHPDELRLDPARTHLPPGGQQEVQVCFQPAAAGVKHILVNVIDASAAVTDVARVVDTLLLNTTSRAPHVDRMFELDVPASARWLHACKPFNAQATRTCCAASARITWH